MTAIYIIWMMRSNFISLGSEIVILYFSIISTLTKNIISYLNLMLMSNKNIIVKILFLTLSELHNKQYILFFVLTKMCLCILTKISLRHFKSSNYNYLTYCAYTR